MSTKYYVLELSPKLYVSSYNLRTKAVYYTDYLLNAVSFEDRERADYVARMLGCTVKPI